MKLLKRFPIILFLSLLLLLFLSLSIGYFIKNKERNETENTELLPIEGIDYDSILDKEGRYYYEDENTYSLFGIDVSTFQGEIDWKKVKEDGVDFAFIRIGRRGATTGLLYPDDRFEENYQGSKNNGLLTGIYFFSQATSVKEAVEEADWVIKQLKDKEIQLPVVYDLEDVYLEDETARTENITREEATSYAIAFCNEIARHGYQPMIYTYLYWAENLYNMENLSEYPIWFAQYHQEKPQLEYPISIWQYSNEGKIDGITEDVDLNILFIQKHDQSE